VFVWACGRVWPLPGWRSDLRGAVCALRGANGDAMQITPLPSPSRIMPATKLHAVFSRQHYSRYCYCRCHCFIHTVLPLTLPLTLCRLQHSPRPRRRILLSSWIGPQVTSAVGRPAPPPQKPFAPPTHASSCPSNRIRPPTRHTGQYTLSCVPVDQGLVILSSFAASDLTEPRQPPQAWEQALARLRE
jgi:hypothetical protein